MEDLELDSIDFYWDLSELPCSKIIAWRNKICPPNCAVCFTTQNELINRPVCEFAMPMFFFANILLLQYLHHI